MHIQGPLKGGAKELGKKEMDKKDMGKPYPPWLVTIGMILLAAEVSAVLYVLLFLVPRILLGGGGD